MTNVVQHSNPLASKTLTVKPGVIQFHAWA